MRLQTVSDKLLAVAPEITPFLLGPIVFGFHSSRLAAPELITRYLIFLLLFISWQVVKYSAFAAIDQRGIAVEDSRGKKEKLNLALLVGSALLTMAFLQLMRLRLPYEHFVLVLFILGLGGLRESVQKKGLLDLANLTSLVYLTGVGYISLALMIDIISWEPIFFALGAACMTLAFEILQYLEQHRDKLPFQRNGTPVSKGGKAVRAVPYLLTCGPTFIAVLSYMNELEKGFALVFITLLLSSRVITALKDAEKSGTLAPRLDQRVAGICVLFVVIIVVASYISI